MSNTVFIEKRVWERKGHGGLSQENDYTVYINGAMLRVFSTHGNMNEGYWGASACKEAREYAQRVSEAVGCEVKEVIKEN